MDKQELILKLIDISLKQINDRRSDFIDCDVDHINADALLLQYIDDPMVTKAFNEIDKWYS
jgi:hypothetical protein